MRHVLVVFLLLMCMLGIVTMFWHQEIKYHLPTPVPAGYQEVQPGDTVVLPPALPPGKAYFLHFYNPDCPCSRFNARHLKSLVNSYGEAIEVVVIVTDEAFKPDARRALGNQLSMVADPGRAIARACGVYATPQAAIIDSAGKLYYRGNYNRSRYCTTRATNFAEVSLLAFLNKRQPPTFGLEATQAYGCELDEKQRTYFFDF